MNSILDLAIDSMEMTKSTAHSYAGMSDSPEDTHAILIAKLNEAVGKAMMAFQILVDMGKQEEASAVLDYFDREIAPKFDQMLEKAWKDWNRE